MFLTTFVLLIDKSCFGTLFDHEDMQEIIRHFPFCHVEAPGQQEGAKNLPSASVHRLTRLHLIIPVKVETNADGYCVLTSQVYLPVHGPAV